MNTLRIRKASDVSLGDVIYLGGQHLTVTEIDTDKFGRELHLQEPTGRTTVRFFADYETLSVEA
jgi:riboflavin synthase alpha subunit